MEIKTIAVINLPNGITLLRILCSLTLLFVFPLTLTWIDLRYSAAVICAVATTAAVYEGYLIYAGRTA